MEQLTLFAAEPPVNPSRLQESEAEWMTRVATWPQSLSEFVMELERIGSCGKTFRGFSQAPRDATLQAYFQGGQAEESKCRKKDGETPELWNPRTTGALELPGVALTLNLSEWTGLNGLCLSDEGVCSLSDILEVGPVPQRYYLSAKACRGILRRSERRGKSLPQSLLEALLAAASEPTSTVTGD